MKLGQQIREIRLEKNLSQRALGEKAGMSQQQIAQYESGKRLPKPSSIIKIADALNVDLSVFTTLYQNEIMGYSSQAVNAGQQLLDNCISAVKESAHYAVERGNEVLREIKETQLMDNFRSLNSEGQNKAIEHVEMLTKIPEYQKKED